MMEPIKKKRCGHCRKNTLILIECPLCRKQYCIYDRTPESHACQNMDAYKDRPTIIDKVMTPKVEYI